MSTSDAPAPRRPWLGRDDIAFGKLLVIANGAVPVGMLAWDALHGQLGANAVNAAIRTTGLLGLLFLVLSLAVTPLRQLTGWSALIAFRRALGLYAFFYLGLHFAIFFGLDRALSLTSTWHEIVTRRYLQIGTLGLVAMVPLAVTSTDAMIRWLGARRWKGLHRLAYLAAVAGVVHYYLLVKADVRQPVAFGAAVGVLLAWRAIAGLRSRRAGPLGRAATAPRFWTGELRVTRIVDETPAVRTFWLAHDGGSLPFEHRPGQYLTLTLRLDNGSSLRRSYTIASPPTRRDHCELTVKRDGLGSGHLHATLREGSLLRVAAPAGRFVFDGSGPDEGVVLLAGGVGITPLMAMVRHLTDRQWRGQIRLIYSVRTPADVIFAAELSDLARRFASLRVEVTVTRPDDTWTGRRGRLSRELIAEVAPEAGRWPVYLCGPDAMMATAREALAALGVPAGRVHTEEFVSPTSPADGRPEAVGDVVEVAASDHELAAAVADDAVRLARSNVTAPIAPGQTVLEAAEAAGVELPYECRSGICGQCKVRLLAGAVGMNVTDSLSASDRKRSLILACQAHVRRGPVVVDA